MIYIISKDTFGSYNIRDIQSNNCWTECVVDGYAAIPDEMVDGILATKGFCDIVLNDDGTRVVSFTAREIPDVPVCNKAKLLSFAESAEHPGCFYRLVNGEKEWFNPPLEDTVDETNENGTEYRTTKRYFGKPVYVQAGTLTGTPTTSTPLGFKVSKSGHVIDKVVSLFVMAKNHSGSQNEYPLPYHTGVGGELRSTYAKTGKRTFAIYAHGVDLTDYVFTYCIEYTKV